MARLSLKHETTPAHSSKAEAYPSTAHSSKAEVYPSEACPSTAGAFPSEAHSCQKHEPTQVQPTLLYNRSVPERSQI